MKFQPRYQPGDRIEGRYQVHKALLGGMGEVYLCLDLKENRPYALKTFQDKFVSNLKIRALLAQEAATWVALERHPHLVQCFFFEVVDNRPFLFLEWVASDTLGRNDLQGWLQGGALDLKLALTFSIDICRGLLHAQQKQPGLVHRDLKPANILIDANHIAKVTDFGLASVMRAAGNFTPITTASAPDQVVGTPPYMAPEQWRNDTLDARTDIYALGCMLYALLTGGPPYVATTLAGFRQQHLDAPLPMVPIDQPRATAINAVLLHCLAKDRAARFPSVSALLNGLIEIYQQQFAESPRFIPASDDFTAIDYSNRGATYDRLGRYTDALADYAQALELDATLARVYINRGNTFAKLQKFAAAIAELTHALELVPRSAQAWTSRGVVYEHWQKYAQALADHQAAIRLDPHYAPAYTNLAAVYEKLQRYEEALRCHHQAIKLDPSLVKAYINRGSTYTRQQQYMQALADYSQAIQLDPTEPQAYHDRGTVYATLNRCDDALRDYAEALRLDPHSAQIYTNRASVYHRLQRFADALADLTYAIEIDSAYAPAYVNRGATYQVLQQYEEALQDYAEAIRLNPNAAKAYYNRGVILWHLGNLPAALAHLEKAAQFGIAQADNQISLINAQLNQQA